MDNSRTTTSVRRDLLAQIRINVAWDRHVPWWRFNRERLDQIQCGFVTLLHGLTQKLFARVAPGATVTVLMERVSHLCECDGEPIPGAGWPYNDQAEVERCDECKRFDDDVAAALAVAARLNERHVAGLPQNHPWTGKKHRYTVVLCDDTGGGGREGWAPLIVRHNGNGVYEELTAGQLASLREAAMPRCKCGQPMRADSTVTGHLHCDGCDDYREQGDPLEYLPSDIQFGLKGGY